MSVFDEAWSVVKRDPRRPWLSLRRPGNIENPHREMIGGGVMMGREGLPEEEEIDDLAPQIDMGGDACCIDAKNKWEEACIEGFPENWDGSAPIGLGGISQVASDVELHRAENEIEHNPDGLAGNYYQSILDKYRNMSCDEFREHLESRLGDITMAGLEGQLGMAAHRILQEWDECTQQSMGLGSDEALDMYRSDEIGGSNNEFDTAWSLVKDLQSTLDEFNRNKNKLARLSVDDGKLNTVEAFSGASSNPNLEAGWSQGFDERGHNVQRIELEQDKQGRRNPGMFGYKPDFNNILDVHAEDIIEGANGEPIHVFTASYPCEDFSLLGGGKKWTDWDTEKKRKFNIARVLQDADFFKDPRVGPTAVEDFQGPGRELLRHTLQVRDDLRRDNPDLIWLLENPNNSLSRYQPELGMEPLIQPRPLGMTSKYRMPQIEGIKPVRIARKPHESPPPSVTHASYAGPLSALLGGSGKPMPGHILNETIPGHIGGLPPRKPTDLWSNLALGIGDFEARPLTTPGVNPNFPIAEYQTPTRYYKEGRVWPPKRFGHAGLFHSVGERGGGGIQRQGAWTSPKGVTIPPYWMRSLIPADLGRDVADAAEKYYGLRDF